MGNLLSFLSLIVALGFIIPFGVQYRIGFDLLFCKAGELRGLSLGLPFLEKLLSIHRVELDYKC